MIPLFNKWYVNRFSLLSSVLLQGVYFILMYIPVGIQRSRLLYLWTIISALAHLVGLLQILRSVSSWSIGFLDADTFEESIHEAYIDAITKAKHYVYIENQFFISLATHNTSVRNYICETLCKRIVRAHK